MTHSIIRPFAVSISGLFFCATLMHSVQAADIRAVSSAHSSGNPLAVQSTVEFLNPPARQVSISVLDMADQPLVHDPVYPLCQQVNELARLLGHGPVLCGKTPDYPTGSGSSSDDSTRSGDDEQHDGFLPGDGPSGLVLLVHGFSITSGHDCESYWQHQKDALEEAGRTALIVGYYENNTNGCDLDLSAGKNFNNFTPLEDIAKALRDWIVDSQSGQYIDIVAHSMGGIVVRKMLDFWGHELLVRNVVTVGTPHDGIKTLHFLGSCSVIYQCLQMSAGSAFMNSLAHNPQSAVETQWTLIAAEGDQVVGADTGIQMDNGDSGGPDVITYQYNRYHKHHCSPNTWPLGHGDLHGDNADKTVRSCHVFGYSTGTVKDPHTRIMDALE